MRVLLVQPPCSAWFIDRVHMHEPLALEYLGAGLKIEGHEVEVLDARLDPDLEGAVRRFRPQIVGLTAYTNQLNVAKDLATRLKALDPEIFVVVGGHHATVRPADFNGPSINLVVIGEGVVALQEVVRNLEAGVPLADIRGIALPGNPMVFSAERPYTALDALPLPDRSITTRYRKHYFSEWLRPLASVRTSLGCTGRCSFCALWSVTGGRYLQRDPERVVAELATVEETNVFFCDDESMCNAGRMDRLADLIREAGIKKRYFLYARADTIVRHPELFAKWRDVGLAQVFVGMESFSDERLRALKKGVTIDQQAQAVRILRELGVLLYASFVVEPSFTREDFRALTRYVRALDLRYASFSVLTPLPGTELYAEREAELTSDRPELFDFLHPVLPTTLPLPEFYAEYARLYEKAIPLRHGLRTVARYGLRRMLPQLGLLRTLLRELRTGYRAHGPQGTAGRSMGGACR